MIPEYKYRVKDYSLLTPFFKEKMVTPLFKMVPWWLPANIITTISNWFIFGALALAFCLEAGNPISLILCSVGILCYTIGDHFDGMQAKRTGTSSALGEFFDHYHDIFNNGILFIILFKLFAITNPYVISFCMVTSYVAHASVFYEQNTTKWLIFEKVGSLESLFLVMLMLISAAFTPLYNIYITEFFGFKVIEIILLLSAFGTLGTMMKVIIRAKIYSMKFYSFVILLSLIGYICAELFNDWQTFLIITLYSGLYIGNLQRGHLVDLKNRYPNFLLPLVLVLAFGLTLFNYSFSLDLILKLIIVYLAVKTIEIVIVCFSALKQFWVWENPPR